MNKLKGLELFNTKIERIRLTPNKEVVLNDFDVEFLKHATNNGLSGASYKIPRQSGRGREFHLRKLMLCELYNSIILIRY